MPKSPPPDLPSGYYHVIVPMDSSDGLPSAFEPVSIRPISEEEAHTLGRKFREIGRNQPCLCGSGKKYKKCCLPQTN
jgi:hypothetical protein